MRRATHMLLLTTVSLLLFTGGCGKKEAYQLTTDEHTRVNQAARVFFTSQTITEGSNSYTGAFLSCMGSDSDFDDNVTCTGQVPKRQGSMVNMAYQESLCNFKGASAGCKPK